MKRFTAVRKGKLLLAAVLAGCLTASPLTAMAAKKVIRLGSAFEEKHLLVQASKKFKEMVEKQSNGTMEVQLFVGGVMGSEEELTESVSIGGVEMQAGGIFPVKSYAPEYAFFGAPFVWKDWDHFVRVWNGPIGQAGQEQIAKKGNTKMLGVIYRGNRQFTSNKPVRTPADVKGIKLRLPQLPSWVAVWKEIGALPVPVALPELFTALQTGVADASEGGVTQIYSFHLNEVQKNLSMTNHLVGMGAMSINKKFFEKLSADQKEIVLKAADAACQWATKETMMNEAGLVDKLKAAGMNVVEADAEAFRKAGEPAVNKLFANQWNVTTWAEVLAQ